MSRFFESPESLERLEKGLEGSESMPPLVEVEMLRRECGDDPLLKNLLKDWLNSSERYTEWVVQYELAMGKAEKDELARLSEARGRIHDGFISRTQVLARNMGEKGKDNAWIDTLGDNRSLYAVLAIKTAYGELKKFFHTQRKTTT